MTEQRCSGQENKRRMDGWMDGWTDANRFINVKCNGYKVKVAVASFKLLYVLDNARKELCLTCTLARKYRNPSGYWLSCLTVFVVFLSPF
jgi:hypothetical protein